MQREDMSREQEIDFVNKCFDEYEREGFSKVFISPYDLKGSVNHQGAAFTVIDRVKPMTETDNGKGTAELETLPLWLIRFDDGEEMAAYPEEIIPSEIRSNVWRTSDKQYFDRI